MEKEFDSVSPKISNFDKSDYNYFYESSGNESGGSYTHKQGKKNKFSKNLNKKAKIKKKNVDDDEWLPENDYSSEHSEYFSENSDYFSEHSEYLSTNENREFESDSDNHKHKKKEKKKKKTKNDMEIVESDTHNDYRITTRKGKNEQTKQLDVTDKENSVYKWEDIKEGENDTITEWMTEQFKPTEIKNMELKEIFETIFEEEFLQQICNYSNLYYKEYISKKYENKKICKWDKVFNATPNFLRRYLSLIVFMGINRTGNPISYFDYKSPLYNHFISSQMSKRDFEKWNKFLVFAPSTNISDDPLHKVRIPLTHFESLWKKFYIPCEFLSIDETMIPYNGRVKFRCYVPRKPHPVGIKAYTLATSPSGYVVKWQIFTGKIDKEPGESSIHRTILNLLHGFEYQGVKLFTDNYFTSISLLEKLEVMGIGLTGTLRANRRIIREFIPENFKKGDVIAKKCRNFIFTCWVDGKRQVPMLSNVFGHKMIIHDRHTRFTRRQYEGAMPLVARMYSRYNHGVDTANAKSSLFRFKHKCQKWYKYIFFYALDITINNAWQFYYTLRKKNAERKEKLTYGGRDFRSDLISYLGDWQPPVLIKAREKEGEKTNDVFYHHCKECYSKLKHYPTVRLSKKKNINLCDFIDIYKNIYCRKAGCDHTSCRYTQIRAEKEQYIKNKKLQLEADTQAKLLQEKAVMDNLNKATVREDEISFSKKKKKKMDRDVGLDTEKETDKLLDYDKIKQKDKSKNKNQKRINNKSKNKQKKIKLSKSTYKTEMNKDQDKFGFIMIKDEDEIQEQNSFTNNILKTNIHNPELDDDNNVSELIALQPELLNIKSEFEYNKDQDKFGFIMIKDENEIQEQISFTKKKYKTEKQKQIEQEQDEENFISEMIRWQPELINDYEKLDCDKIIDQDKFGFIKKNAQLGFIKKDAEPKLRKSELRKKKLILYKEV